MASGRPVFYWSSRRTHGATTRRIVKFRTMVRNAEAVLNRDTVPVLDSCFLNIPPEHPVYTSVGRVIERIALTELPQLAHVLVGHMSLVGNRPLPENVVRALRTRYPDAEDRFLIRGGLTGPVQLVGRNEISDPDRLGLEIDYCLVALYGYTMKLDFLFLWNTVLVALKLRRPFSVQAVRSLMIGTLPRSARAADAAELAERRRSIRFVAPMARVLRLRGDDYHIRGFSHCGLRLSGPAPISVGEHFSVRAHESMTIDSLLSVKWCAPNDEGGFELGLAFQSAHGVVENLISMIEGRVLSAARPPKQLSIS
jgi:lipopolysaccharide/colanic/teichoic acid biosynthesis glycosyltransferase